jgi:hypothetical protein
LDARGGFRRRRRLRESEQLKRHNTQPRRRRKRLTGIIHPGLVCAVALAGVPSGRCLIRLLPVARRRVSVDRPASHGVLLLLGKSEVGGMHALTSMTSPEEEEQNKENGWRARQRRRGKEARGELEADENGDGLEQIGKDAYRFRCLHHIGRPRSSHRCGRCSTEDQREGHGRLSRGSTSASKRARHSSKGGEEDSRRSSSCRNPTLVLRLVRVEAGLLGG